MSIQGGSAGGRSVMIHLVAPFSQGKFRAAWADSGGFFKQFWNTADDVYDKWINSCLRNVATCRESNSSSAQLRCLEDMHGEALLEALQKNCTMLVALPQPSSAEKWAYSPPGGVVPNMRFALCNPELKMSAVPFVSSEAIDSVGYFNWDFDETYHDLLSSILGEISEFQRKNSSVLQTTC